MFHAPVFETDNVQHIKTIVASTPSNVEFNIKDSEPEEEEIGLRTGQAIRPICPDEWVENFFTPQKKSSSLP